MSTPSFAQLFRRSRYAKGALGCPVDDARQHRTEVFAVAAVGFVLKHDAEFKRHLLKSFAGISENPGAFEPQLQVADESDLRLVDDKEKRLVVIEFKVWARVEPHQDPWHEGGDPRNKKSKFWRDGGYGKKLSTGAHYQNYDRIWYCTVQQADKFEKGSDIDEMPDNRKQFWLRRRAWKELQQRDGTPESPLEKDLLDSLGEIGVTDFQDRHMKTIKVTAEEIQASIKGARVVQVLLWLCQMLRCNPTKTPDLRMRADGEEWFGVYYSKKGSNYSWFGYRVSKGKADAVVEFAFEGVDRAERLETLKKELSQRPNNTLVLEEHPAECSYLHYSRSENSTLNDLEWFKCVLEIEK